MYNVNDFNSWIISLGNSKPYKIMLKNGAGFYQLIFLYDSYHYSDEISFDDLKNQIECQKKVLKMCAVFEQNIKLKKF